MLKLDKFLSFSALLPLAATAIVYSPRAVGAPVPEDDPASWALLQSLAQESKQERSDWNLDSTAISDTPTVSIAVACASEEAVLVSGSADQRDTVDSISCRLGSAVGLGAAALGGLGPPPPPDPRSLVIEVYGEGRLPSPAIHLGPDPSEIAIKVPVWMWIDDPDVQPTVITDPSGVLSITVQPRVVSTVWAPGEPLDNPDKFGSAGTVEPVVCEGLGTPPPPEVSRDDIGPCSHTYRWRATAERTDDRCTWPLTVTINWAVDWTASTGESGSLTRTTSTTTPVIVGEWRTVLVDDPSSPLPDLTNPRCSYD